MSDSFSSSAPTAMAHGAHRRGLVARLVAATPLMRRFVTIPSYAVAWLWTTGLAPLWLPIATLFGLWRRQSFVVLRLWLFLWLYLSFALLALCACLVARFRGQAKRKQAMFRISRWYGNALFTWCARLLSLSVVVERDERRLCGPLLVLVRHASIVDAVLPPALLSTHDDLEIRYVVRKELMLEPCLDVIGHAGVHCFVDRDAPAGRELIKVGNVARSLGEEAIAIYPEGTRFSRRKRDDAIVALERARPELAMIAKSMTHVLPPRVAGVVELLEAAPEADCLVLAHRGLEGFARPRDFLDGSVVGREVEIKMWRIARQAIPSREHQPRWLFELWREVGNFVSEPCSSKAPPCDDGTALKKAGSTRSEAPSCRSASPGARSRL